MKKNLILTLVCVLALTGISGCGSKKTNYEPTEKDFEKAVVAAFEELEKESESEYAYEKTAQVSESVKSNDSYKKYDKSPEWANKGAKEWAIQIDDVYYEAGMLLDDVVKMVEASEVDYTMDYNSGRLVDSGKHDTLVVKRDGTEWFTINYKNPDKDVNSAKNCVVYFVEPSENGKIYSRFFDGRSYEDILNMEYDNLTALAEMLELEKVNVFSMNNSNINRYTTKDESYKGSECIKFSMIPYYETSKAVKTIGYNVGTEIMENIYLDKNTGKVVDMDISYSVSYLERAVSSDLTAEDIEPYKDYIYEQLVRENMEVEKVLGYAYVNTWNGYRLYLVVYGKDNDYGSEGYFYGNLSSPSITVNGFESSYTNYVGGWSAYDSLQELIEDEMSGDSYEIIWTTFSE